MTIKWEQRKVVEKNKIDELSKQLGISQLVAQLLLNRNLDTEEKIADFFDTSVSKIDDPFLMNDMQKAVSRIEQALDNGEKIVIYGDYDADGLTSTSIMKEAIEILGGQVQTYIPDRFSDGYGPHLEVYKRLINEGCQLIITVDNGVSGYEAVEYANSKGVDVVITDHHSLPEQLPNAAAIVHPRIADHEYTCQVLSGAGVAFKVASALLQEVPTDLLDLAAIGTISDVVELKGENRAIVSNGLKQLQTGTRIGLKALFDVGKLDITQANEDTIGFQVAPRLNALGRIKNANIGVDLLTAIDYDSAKVIAKDVDETNVLRKEYSEEIYQQAKEQVDKQQENFQIIYGDDWHEGVLGIVAGRIASDTNKPTLVLSKQKGSNMYKGSGRSPESFNLFEALDKYRDLFVSFGGHAQACGASIMEDKLDTLVADVQKEIAVQDSDASAEKISNYDLELSINDLSMDLLKQINTLAPFGQGNTKPVFKTTNVEISNEKYIGSDKTHLKGKIKKGNSSIDFIAFSFAEEFNLIQDIPLYKVFYQIDINDWRGRKTLQLMMEDIQSNASGSTIVDWRGHKFEFNNLDEDIKIIFFNKRYYDLFVNKNGTDRAYLYTDLNIKQAKRILVFDRPHDIQKFVDFINIQQAEIIYLLFYSQLKYSYDLVPDKTEMHNVLRYFLSHQGIKESDYETVAKYLNININNLKFYMRVFFELNFVRIDEGVIIPLTVNRDVTLESSKYYQKRLKRNEVGSVLVNTSYQELLTWIEKQ